MDDYVCVDLETTGLSPRGNEIIEIGAAKVKEGKVVEVFQELVKPSVRIPSRITMITGITDSMVSKKSGIGEVFPKFVEFLEGMSIIAHNINFDYGFLLENAARLKIKFECKGIDTLKIARGLLTQLPSKSLGALCEHYQITNPHAHRASDDAIATVKVYEAMKFEFSQARPNMFQPSLIGYTVKKKQEATSNQKEQLNNLLQKHNLQIGTSVDEVDRGTASRLVNYIVTYYEKIEKK